MEVHACMCMYLQCMDTTVFAIIINYIPSSMHAIRYKNSVFTYQKYSTQLLYRRQNYNS